MAGRAGIFGVEVEAAVWSAALRRTSRGPETIVRCQGWMLEFEGESWASWRAVVRRGRATGVERNWRVECRVLIAESRLEDSDGSFAAMICWYLRGAYG